MSTTVTETRQNNCASCGTQHEAQARFCSGCGKGLGGAGTNNQTNRKWWIQIVLIVLLSLILLKTFTFTSEGPNTSEAARNGRSRFDASKTVNTFIDCKRLWDFSVKAPDAELVQQKRFDDYVSQALAHAKHNRNVADRLRKLDTVGVDPDISTFVLEAAEMFDLFAGFSDQKRLFVERLKEHVDEFASWGAMLESFARGFIGDPFGKSREALRDQERLKEMWEEARTTEEKLKEIAVLIDQKDSRLQLYLQTEYGARFSR